MNKPIIFGILVIFLLIFIGYNYGENSFDKRCDIRCELLNYSSVYHKSDFGILNSKCICMDNQGVLFTVFVGSPFQLKKYLD